MDPKLEVTAISGFFVPAFRGGGPIRTIEAMADTHKASVKLNVVTSNTDLGLADPLDVQTGIWTKVGSANCYYIEWSNVWRRLAGIVMAVRKKSDYLYINGLFAFWTSILPLIVSRLGLAGSTHIVIAPRGELGPGAKHIGRTKKRLFLQMARIVRLHQSAIWHASSNVEESEIRQEFPSAKVVIRENETALPEKSVPPIVSPLANQSLHAIYVGRLSAKKGVTSLLSALSGVSSPLRFDIYGAPEDTAYWEELNRLCNLLPGHIDVRLLGPLPHESVMQEFGRHEIFLCPTSHENFGHTIAESLAASCPVMIKEVTPFTPMIKRGAGVLIEDDSPDAWSMAINRYAELPSSDRLDRRRLAGMEYDSWRLLGGGPSVFELCEGLYKSGAWGS